MNHYKIYPLITLYSEESEMSMQTYGMNFGVNSPSPIIMWLVQGNGHNIMVDTGSCGAEPASRNHHASIRTEEMEPVNLLKKCGVTGEDIDIVVLTHLHWDHCYNLELFPNAKIYVQRREVEYAIDPLPPHRTAYEAPKTGIPSAWFPHLGRMTIMDGDFSVCEGINAYLLPGHTPGIMGVTVETEGGVYLIASDILPLFKNWTGQGNQKHIPAGIHNSLDDYYRSLERIEGLCDYILPGHDKAVMDYQEFPCEIKELKQQLESGTTR